MFIATLIAAASLAAADDIRPAPADAPGWRLLSVTDATRSGDAASLGYALYTADPSRPSLFFRCTDGRLRAGVSLENADIRDVLSVSSMVSTLRAARRIGDAPPLSENWGFLRKHKVAFPYDPATAARLYNAAGRGETIRLSIGRYKDVDISPPPPSLEKFETFFSDCGLKQRDG